MHGNGVVVVECSGREPLGTHVNEEMAAFVEAEADRLDVSKSDFLRLLLVAYRDGSSSPQRVC